MTDKLKAIIAESENIERLINHDPYGGVCTLSGEEFEVWRGKIRTFIARFENNELKTCINKTLEGFNGYSDVKDFHKLVGDLNVLLTNIESQVVSLRESAVDRRKVLVIHDCNEELSTEMFSFLREMELNPIEWGDVEKMIGKSSPLMGEVLCEAFNTVQAILFMLTTDGDGFALDGLTSKEQSNLIFKAGMAIGINDSRTLLIELGKNQKLGDLVGEKVIKFDGSSDTKKDLIKQLKIAGVEVGTKAKSN